MSEASKKAREAMKSKIARLVRTDPKMKVDASGYTPPDMLNADVQTGLRPISRRQFKKGGKVMKVEGEQPYHNAGRKPRKNGGKALTPNSLLNRNVREANEQRHGSKHVGGFKKGGWTYKAGGGNLSVEDADTGRPSLRMIGKHVGSKGHTTKVYKDRETGEHRVKYFKPDGTYMPKADSYHYDDRDDAMDTAKHMAEKGYKRGGTAKHDDTAQDTKLIKKLVKPSAMKGHAKGCTCKACGGSMSLAEGGKIPPINYSENESGAKPILPPNTKPAPSESRVPLTIEQLKARGLDRNNPPKTPDNRKRGGRMGSKMSVSDGSFEGTRPTGGRLARKHGGNAGKGKMNVNIIIGGGHKGGMGAPDQGGLMPPPAGNPMAIPPGGMPPGGPPPGGPPPGGPPMPPPMPPPGAGGPPPMMGRKTGGRVSVYAPKQHGAGGGLGRLQKIKAYGNNAGHVVASKAK